MTSPSLARCGRALWVSAALAAAVSFLWSNPAQAEPAQSGQAQRPAPKAVNLEFTTALRSGDQAYLAKRYPEAAAEYRKAIAAERHNPVGYARLAAAQRQQGQFDEALETLSEGLQTSATLTERAKLIFLQADIHERKFALDKAEARWRAYLEAVGGTGERTIDLDAPEAKPQPAVPGETVYPSTADERLQQASAAQKRYEEYADVRARIKKREQEAEEKSRKR